MRTVAFVRPFRAGKLYDELTAAVPVCRPTTDAAGDQHAQLTILGTSPALTLRVPDDAPDAAIAAVVAAHDATTPSAAEARETTRQAHEAAWATELQALLVRLDAGTATASDQRRVSALLVRIVLRLLD